MIKVSLEEVEYLKKNKYIKCEGGKYPCIAVTNIQGKSKKKQRYIEDNIYNKYLKGRNITK